MGHDAGSVTVSTVALLLTGASLLLFATAVSLMLVLRTQAEEKTLQQRMDGIIASRRPSVAQSDGRVSITMVQTPRSLGHRLLALFGIKLSLATHYRAPWWVILLVTLAVARGVTWLEAFVVGPLAILDMPLLWVFICRRVTAGMIDRHHNKMRVQMPDALGMMVRAVRVGVPLAEGIRAVAKECPLPTSANFAQVGNELAIGVTLEDALKNMTRLNDIQEYRFLATALSLQAQTGGGLSETLDGLAEVMRKRTAAKAKGYALAAEARTSATVLAGLPVVTLIGLMLMNPAYMMRLFTDPLGNKILAGACVSLGTGMFIMRSLIRRSLS